MLAIAIAAPGVAQDFHFGVKVGVPLTEYFSVGPAYSSATTRYTFGVSAEYRMWHGLGFELDALYRHMGYVGRVQHFSRNPPFITDTFNVKGSSWEFPLLLKYRIGLPLHPYLIGGGVLRYVGSARERGIRVTDSLGPGPAGADVFTTTQIDTSDPPDLSKRVWPGLTVGGGVELGLLPELRYTRWTSNIGSDFSPLRFQQNEAVFLLGFTF